MDIKNLESYRKITYPGVNRNSYLISENGDVYSLLTDKHLKPNVHRDGYLKIVLSGKTIFIHQLVAFQFVPNPNKNPTVDHLDGNKTNNHYSNLEWVTSRENIQRAKGDNVYSEEFVRQICEYYENGNTVKDVFRILKGDFARAYEDKALYMFLRRLKERKLWSDITREYAYLSDTNSDQEYDLKPTKDNVFSEEEIHKICSLLERRYSAIRIIEEFFGGRDTEKFDSYYGAINAIRSRKNWDYITKHYNYTVESTSERPSIVGNEFYNLAMQGYTVQDMRKLYGIKRAKDNPIVNDRMKKAYYKYHTIKNLSDKEDIKIIS